MEKFLVQYRMDTARIRSKLHLLLRQYHLLSEKKFIPGKSLIRYAGAVYNEKELNSMTDAMLGGWFGLSQEAEKLEKELALYIGARKSFLTNSGSSADLLAVTSLMSQQFSERLKPGDEVITPACTFPTVVSSLYYNKLKPVFVDVDVRKLNPEPDNFERAISKKTRAILLVHQLGNPCEMDEIMRIARKHHLLVIEDNCDALGSTYKGKNTGSFGILSTQSFYPAHHITMAGEGGAVYINDSRFIRIVQSLRDWGRACWCGAAGGGPNGECGIRFNYTIDGVPYDHKYMFTHIGFNLKPVEIQAAMGRVQLKKLPTFIKKRKKNFQKLYEFFTRYQSIFLLPQATPFSDPSWFSFPLTIRKNVRFDRLKLTRYLEDHQIQTRPMFTGNILRQPAFKNLNCRVSGRLSNADFIHTNTFFIGVYPGIGIEQMTYIKKTFSEFIKRYG